MKTFLRLIAVSAGLLAALPSQAQWNNLHGSNVRNGSGGLLASGQFCVQPVDNNNRPVVANVASQQVAATWTLGSVTLNGPFVSVVYPGEPVQGPGIPAGATVVARGSGTLTISAATTIAASSPATVVIGGGAVITGPACTTVTNGAFGTPFANNLAAYAVPDTAMTNPLNLCLRVTVTDANQNGKVVYSVPCAQPSSTASWCTFSSTSGNTDCNYDLYSPLLPTQALVQQVGAVGPAGPTGPTGPTGPIGSAGPTGPPGTISNFSGSATGGALNASVNTQINVMAAPYNATGNCTTDDTPAIAAAQTAAITYQTGNNLPAALYFPKPPGGCYIVSDFVWKGVGLLGPATTGLAAASPYQSAVTFKSLPGHDVMHKPDPTFTTGTITVNPGWAIENISFIVDNSVAPITNTSHRWPGRWFDDGVMTSGSAAFSTVAGKVSCGDVGQAIKVGGAGAAGADLVTTILSVSPCWTPSTQSGTDSWQKITLAAAASTTVSAAHTYLSVLGLPVTENIGNCAIAFDMADGNPADWVGTEAGGNYGRMDNVTFANVSGYANDSCGIYVQGKPYFYGIIVNNFAFFNDKFSVVQSSTELNSNFQSDAGDFQHWNHGIFSQAWNPWISINGLSNKLKHVQYNIHSGVQIMQLGNTAFDQATGWDIDLGGEAPGGSTVYGHRIDGNDDIITGDFAVAGTSQVGYADINSSIIYGDVINTQLNGFGIDVIEPNVSSGIVNNGYGNRVRAIYSGSGSPNGMANNYWITGVPCKGYLLELGCMTPDFLLDGNFTTPYNHTDQLIVPKDVVLDPANPYTTYIATDATAKTGFALIVSGTAPTANYSQFMQYAETSNTIKSPTPGTNFPTTGGTFVFSAKCPTGSSFTVFAKFASTFTQTFSCTTSYQQYSIPMALVGGDIGQPFQFGGSGGSGVFWVEWAAVIPRPNLPAGTTIGGNGVVTGPATTVVNAVPCYANTTGLQQDCSSSTGPTINIAAAGATFTFQSNGGTAFALKGAASSNTVTQYWYTTTRYWQVGLESNTSYTVFDNTNGRSILTFPNNTMPAGSIGGNATGATLLTIQSATNCSSSAAPAVCGSAASGSVVVAAAATTVQVNTTAVTANSQIHLQFDPTLSTRLSVTCNTTYVEAHPTTRTAATSFVVTVASAPTTNPACFSYTIVN
jgi:hypothetical protein